LITIFGLPLEFIRTLICDIWDLTLIGQILTPICQRKISRHFTVAEQLGGNWEQRAKKNSQKDYFMTKAP